MKLFLIIFSVMIQTFLSQNAWAGWECTATCNGNSYTVLSSLYHNASSGETSDFKVNCTDVLGGVIGTTSPGSCGGIYYYCQKWDKTSYQVTGSGDGLIAARQEARASCQGNNFNNHNGSGCPYDYNTYYLDEKSFKCSQ